MECDRRAGAEPQVGGRDDQDDEEPQQFASVDRHLYGARGAGAAGHRAGVPLRRGWPCRAGRDNFLYDFKRAVLGRRPPGTRGARIPRLAAVRPRRALPGACPSQPEHGEEERGGGVVDRPRASRAAPGTLHPDADRPTFAGRSGCTRPVPCRGPEKSRPATGMVHQFRGLLSSSTPDRRRSACALATLPPRQGGRPFGATDQPAKNPTSFRRPPTPGRFRRGPSRAALRRRHRATA
jgi:hypothetical protein